MHIGNRIKKLENQTGIRPKLPSCIEMLLHETQTGSWLLIDYGKCCFEYVVNIHTAEVISIDRFHTFPEDRQSSLDFFQARIPLEWKQGASITQDQFYEGLALYALQVFLESDFYQKKVAQ